MPDSNPPNLIPEESPEATIKRLEQRCLALEQCVVALYLTISDRTDEPVMEEFHKLVQNGQPLRLTVGLSDSGPGFHFSYRGWIKGEDDETIWDKIQNG